MNLGYISNGKNKIIREQLRYDFDEPIIPFSEEDFAAKEKRIQSELAILDSYDLKQLEIPHELEQELLRRGMSQGERVCRGCFKIIKDEGFPRCQHCLEKQRINNEMTRKEYYQVKIKGTRNETKQKAI